MKKEIIKTEKAFIAKSPLSQAIKVGNLLFCSGLAPLDTNTGKLVSEDFTTQARCVLEYLKAILEAAGTRLENVIKTTVYLVDMSRFQEMNEIYREYFPENFPARTCIGVKELPRNSQIEIELIAMI
jgi:2-iminobutanoate/2-iminopropanoate deaminase